MMELPETVTIGCQAATLLAGRRVTDVLPPTHLHRFTFFNGATEAYRALLVGRCVLGAEGHGIFVDIRLEDGVCLSMCDGVNLRYGPPGTAAPSKYQMLLTLDDESLVVFTTRMYGGIYAFRGALDNKYRRLSLERPSPLTGDFDETYFDRLLGSERKDVSVKGFLATGQRIPGLGNGVLQDILFHACIAPQRRIRTLSDAEKNALFRSLRRTLRAMADGGGRDTETDFFGRRGGYGCILSKNTWEHPCPRCGSTVRKASYMGGSVYWCPVCQRM